MRVTISLWLIAVIDVVQKKPPQWWLFLLNNYLCSVDFCLFIVYGQYVRACG